MESNRGGLVGEDSGTDRFPVGMRVLAVDDDPICLKVLENLLRKCQYQVTTANQAVTALRLLRENRNKYDLVISDVNMPDMNGFKLLELVGLEMDLPVIMLSAHSDTELVMKGVTHGACDYLLKPVRIEELKNIWQHVIRKKKVEPKDQNKASKQSKDHLGVGDSGQGATSSGNGDQSEKSNRKRKDHSEDEEEDGEEDGPENDDPSTQKKPRVVWSVDLHRKFVGAVNQLGLDKAVPKKILDLMNVEGLTRENVASHLQKYRLYLKRISQQPNMVALGCKDSGYLRMGSLDGFGDFSTLSGSGRFSNASLSSYTPGGVLGRLNSPAGLGLRGISSSGLIQPGPQNLNNSLNSLGKLQSAALPANQSASLFQGIPTSLDFNQLQHSKIATPVAEFSNIDDPTSFVGTSYQDTRATNNCSSNSIVSTPSNPLILPGNPQQSLNRGGGFSNQSSLRTGPGSIEIGACGSSNFLDQSRCNDSWQGAVQLSNFPSNPLLLSEPFSHCQMPSNNLVDGISSGISHIRNNPIEMCSTGAVPVAMEDSRGDVQCQGGLIGNVVQNINFTPKQRWENRGLDYNYGMNNTFSSVNSLLPSNGAVGSLDQNRKVDTSLIPQSMGTRMRSNEEYLLEQPKAQDGFNHESLNDLVNAMNKREQNTPMSMDGEYGFDAYSLGSCI